jgi:choline dehydrogenase-like flavoprotein
MVPDIKDPWLIKLLRWADEFRRLGVRANADYPRDAQRAREYGAEGIGLCRTEHMFFETERLEHFQKMIMTDLPSERREALEILLPYQREDFAGIFRIMNGLPVIIRLIDPPLHEFLPKREDLMVEIARLEATGGDPVILEEKRGLLHRVEQLHEFNPMLGHRGVRLGISFPEIYEMQIRAVFEVQGVKTLNKQANSLLGKAAIGLEYLFRRSGPMSMAPSQLGCFTRSSADFKWPNVEYHVQPLSLDAFGERGAGNVFHAFHQTDEPVAFVRRDRCEAHAAVAHHGGGHAMPAGGREVGVPGGLAVVVGVNVHPAGCEH